MWGLVSFNRHLSPKKAANIQSVHQIHYKQAFNQTGAVLEDTLARSPRSSELRNCILDKKHNDLEQPAGNRRLIRLNGL